MKNIDWSAAYSDSNFTALKKSKDFMYDTIIGELNRISVSDDYKEKKYLLSCLKHNIITYYDKCVECSKILDNYTL